MQEIAQVKFLPTSKSEMENLAWPSLDILFIIGDAYLDHPAQGPALLGRWLLAHGFKVGIIAQPNWQNPESFLKLGIPNLMVGISAGSMDSMLAAYTAFRKKRNTDTLSPGGKIGLRPNRATLTYSAVAKGVFKNTPIVIGGLEASLRRLSHYDFWQDKLRRSFLLEAKADLLIYGPGEKPLLEIAQKIKNNLPLNNIKGTVEKIKTPPAEAIILPSHEEIEKDRINLLKTALISEQLIQDGPAGLAAFQASGHMGILINPPAESLTEKDLDFIYTLPYSYQAHPQYKEKIPALEVLRNSLTSHRGCGGGCSFCSLALHQGRKIISRSEKSILEEAEKLAGQKTIALSDVGGPTANMWQSKCTKKEKCQRRSCLWPNICKFLKNGQKSWINMLLNVNKLKGIKQVRVASGLRYDLALTDKESLRVFLQNFVGGQLTVAPEHLDDEVLNLMRKPKSKIFKEFLSFFNENKIEKQYLIPYLISSFPGSSDEKMQKTVDFFHKQAWYPQQAQSFIPTPGTVATAMYYSQKDEDGNKLIVNNNDKQRLQQHYLLYNKKR